jgi:hypothetical protein
VPSGNSHVDGEAQAQLGGRPVEKRRKLSGRRSRAGAEYGILELLIMGNIGLRRLVS